MGNDQNIIISDDDNDNQQKSGIAKDNNDNQQKSGITNDNNDNQQKSGTANGNNKQTKKSGTVNGNNNQTKHGRDIHVVSDDEEEQKEPADGWPIWECDECVDEIEPEEEMDASNWHPFCITECPRCGELRPELEDVDEKFANAAAYSTQILDQWASRYADDDIDVQ